MNEAIVNIGNRTWVVPANKVPELINWLDSNTYQKAAQPQYENKCSAQQKLIFEQLNLGGF